MVVVGDGTVERTFLQAVNRVLEMCGENGATTLLTPTKRIENAMRAVSDARDDIYYEKLWEFRRGFFQISLTALQMWYALPADYMKMSRPVSRNTNAEHAIPYIAYDDLATLHPDIRQFPPGSAVGGTSVTTQAARQSHSFGTPEHHTTSGGYVGFYPIPDSDFVSAEDGLLVGSYWKQAPPLTSDNDDLGIPRSLWSAHHKLALADFKKSVEYPDWGTDKQDGLRQLHKQTAAPDEQQDLNHGYDPMINYNE